MKDINGDFLYEGCYIQGYNNKKHAGDKSRLYKTGIMEYYPGVEGVDTFEIHPETGKPWYWRVEHKDMLKESLRQLLLRKDNRSEIELEILRLLEKEYVK